MGARFGWNNFSYQSRSRSVQKHPSSSFVEIPSNMTRSHKIPDDTGLQGIKRFLSARASTLQPTQFGTELKQLSKQKEIKISTWCPRVIHWNNLWASALFGKLQRRWGGSRKSKEKLARPLHSLAQMRQNLPRARVEVILSCSLSGAIFETISKSRESKGCPRCIYKCISAHITGISFVVNLSWVLFVVVNIQLDCTIVLLLSSTFLYCSCCCLVIL